MTTTATAYQVTANTSTFPLLPFEEHPCAGYHDGGPKPRATWAVYVTVAPGFVASMRLCDSCQSEYAANVNHG